MVNILIRSTYVCSFLGGTEVTKALFFIRENSATLKLNILIWLKFNFRQIFFGDNLIYFFQMQINFSLESDLSYCFISHSKCWRSNCFRWNNCTRSSSCVVHHQKSTGREKSCHMQPYSNLNISIDAVLLRSSRIFHLQLYLSWILFLR